MVFISFAWRRKKRFVQDECTSSESSRKAYYNECNTSLTENKTENSKFHIFNFDTSQSITNNFSTRKRLNNFFTTLRNTSNKQHETGKPKGSSAKRLLKILITGKLKSFVFGGEN